MKVLLTVGMVLMATQSLATGGVSCYGENADAKIVVGITTGTNGDVVNAFGEVNFKKSQELRDVESVEFNQSNLKQNWVNDKQVNLKYHFETQSNDFGTLIDVTVEAKKAKDGQIKGTATVKKAIVVNDLATESLYKVPVTCDVE